MIECIPKQSNPMNSNDRTNICGAKKRNGEPCKKYGMPNGRCRLHGGLSIAGLQHSRTNVATYRGKEIPAKLYSHFQCAKNDPELLSTRDDITLLDARLSILIDTTEALNDKEIKLNTELWIEIRQILQERKLLAESERKRLIDMQQMITTEKAMLLVSALAGIIKEHVTDNKTLSKISNDMSKLLSRE